MEIDLLQLDPGGRDLAEQFEATDLVLGDGSGDERLVLERATLRGHVRPDRGGVRATGRIEADVRAECDRCLKPVPLRIDGTFDQRYEWGAGSTEEPRDEEVDPWELDVERLERAVLDTRVLVAEQIELHAPARVVCATDCAGLCPGCGANLNRGDCGCDRTDVDPRWEALKQFKT